MLGYSESCDSFKYCVCVYLCVCVFWKDSKLIGNSLDSVWKVMLEVEQFGKLIVRIRIHF